jgi:hypothetical protein
MFESAQILPITGVVGTLNSKSLPGLLLKGGRQTNGVSAPWKHAVGLCGTLVARIETIQFT